MTREDLYRLLPHRPPFLFLSDIVEITPERARAVYDADPDAPFFQGHFPGRPIMPGVLQCECCLQAGAALLAHRLGVEYGRDAGMPVVTRILEAKFKRMAPPGARLVIDVSLEEEMGGAYFMTGKVSLEEHVAARLKFAVTPATIEETAP